MALKSILNFFSPKDKTFFPLFEQATNKLTKMAENLHEAANADKGDRKGYFDKIDDLADSIESISHKMNIELSKNFITPFDREDIHALMSTIEDVSATIHEASNRIRLYHVEKITKSMRKITEINLEAVQLIGKSVSELKDAKNYKTVFDAVKKINKLDRKSDSVFEKAISDVFENETDAKTIIKFKEVLASLDKASDKCKSVARVLEAVAVKHA